MKSGAEFQMGLLQQWSAEGFLTPEAIEKLSLFLDLLTEWNPKINLTGLRSRNEMEEILIGESVLATRVYPLAGKRVLDVGSGAGIPGLVWAVVIPSIRLTSVEVRQKKVAFQKEVVRTLLLQAEIVPGLFPDAVAGARFDVVATRAVRISQLWIEQAVPLLNPGGVLLRFAGAKATEAGWESYTITDRSTVLLRHA